MHAVRAEQGLSEVEGPYRSTCARIGPSCAASTSLSCTCEGFSERFLVIAGCSKRPRGSARTALPRRSIRAAAPTRRRAAAAFRRGRHIYGCSRNGRSEEHTSELQSLMRISYAVFCLKKKKQINKSKKV